MDILNSLIDYAQSLNPEFVLFVGGSTFALFIVFLAFRPLMRDARITKQVMRTGVEATATIIRTWDTGVRLNDEPQLGILLQVQPPGGASFQTELKTIVPLTQLAAFQPGAQLQIKYDPAEPSHVAILGIGPDGTAESAANRQQIEQMLLQYQAENDRLVERGMEAAAKVLKYMPMGIEVNGDNPVVNLVVEVQATNGKAFVAQASGIAIAQASVPKYQPGQMLTVCYDPNDLTKVGVVHAGV